MARKFGILHSVSYHPGCICISMKELQPRVTSCSGPPNTGKLSPYNKLSMYLFFLFFVWCIDMLFKKAVEKYQKYNKNSLCKEEKNKRKQTKTQKSKEKLLRQIALMGKDM